MILREWRGRVPLEKADAYLAFLDRKGTHGYASTPGHLGTWVTMERRPGTDEAEFLLLTQWESLGAIKAFAGNDISRAVYYPEDDEFLIDKPPTLRHYEILRAS